MSESSGYQYLGPRPGSAYRSWFVKGTRIRAIVLASALRPAPDEGYLPTPESVAADYNLPVEAVREAAHYCEANPRQLQADKRWDELFDAVREPRNGLPGTDEMLRIDRQVVAEFGPK